MTKRDFIDISYLTKSELSSIVDLGHLLKKRYIANRRPLDNKTLVSIFEKTSTRTRVSFEVGIQQLGGHSVVITNKDSQLGKGETIEDTAKVLSRFGNIIMARVNKHSMIESLAKNSTVPVINGLSDYSHPCQIIADILTYEEKMGAIKGTTIAWVGDGNNVCHSWIHAAEKLEFTLNIVCPKGYEPCPDTVKTAQDNGAVILVTNDIAQAVTGSDAVVTDTWVSMGDEDEAERLVAFAPYQVNMDVMALAKKQALFLHCLPAYRGQEVTADVIDGHQSVVFDEAENRLHAQKAIMVWCLQAEDLV